MIVDVPLLLLDQLPWYDPAADFESRVRTVFDGIFPCILGPREVADHCARLSQAAVPRRSIVLVPLMAGTLLYRALVPHCADNDCLLVPLPMSRHPYVTLAFDSVELLNKTLAAYSAAADCIWAALPDIMRRAAAGEWERVVYIDVNSTTGRDALLVERIVQRMAGTNLPVTFAILIEESERNLHQSTGWRSAAKVRIPDFRALRLIEQNTKYFSHLVYLQMDENSQYRHAETCRRNFPTLLRFWDEIPADLRDIHGYDRSQLSIVTRRLHLRYSKAEVEREAQSKVAKVWDAETWRAMMAADVPGFLARRLERVLGFGMVGSAAPREIRAVPPT
jgi:hypothetical protein